jgi:hypothetical protein
VGFGWIKELHLFFGQNGWLSRTEKPLKHLELEVECGFLMSQNSQGFTRNLAKSLQNMTPKRTDASPDLFGISLAQLINLDHPLCRFSCLFDWEEIRREIEPSFCDANGRPGADVRVVVGLFYLKIRIQSQ